MKRLAFLFGLLLGTIPPATAQLVVEGIEIRHSEDSLAARRVLKEVPPTSSFWAEQHAKPGNLSAAEALGEVLRAAFPSMNPAEPSTAVLDTGMGYAEEIATRHPEKGVRAEFAFDLLRTASHFDMEERAALYYRQLMQEHEETSYAEMAGRFAPSSFRDIHAGKPVPEFSLTPLSSTADKHTSENLKGKTYLIDFWGTWCPPCLEEMPNLHEAYEKYRSANFTILSVALDDSIVAVQRFREEKWPMPWKHAVIEEGSRKEKEIKEKFEIFGVPKAILVNDEGTIIATESELRGQRLDDTLSRVLK